MFVDDDAMCNAGLQRAVGRHMINSCKSNESLENFHFPPCRSLNGDLDGIDSNVAGMVRSVLESIPMTIECTFRECRQPGSHVIQLQ